MKLLAHTKGYLQEFDLQQGRQGFDLVLVVYQRLILRTDAHQEIHNAISCELARQQTEDHSIGATHLGLL